MKGKLYRKAKRDLPAILTGVSVISFGGALYLTHVRASKAHKLLKKAKKKKKRKLTIFETVQTIAPAYWPVGILAGVGAGAAIGSQALNAKQIAAIGAAYGMLSNKLSTQKQLYDQKIKEIAGPEKAKEIKKEIQEETTKPKSLPPLEEDSYWWCEVVSQYTFYAKLSDVIAVWANMNKLLALEGSCTIADVVDMYKSIAEVSCMDRMVISMERCRHIGWDYAELCENYDYPWLDFDYTVLNDPTSDKVDFKFNEGRITRLISCPFWPSDSVFLYECDPASNLIKQDNIRE